MKEIKIYSNFKVFDSIDELPDQIKVLFNKAKLIRESAYSEYSKFSVGAAVLLENGEIVCGSNQENASYPSGLCAERTALFYANSKYPKIKIKEIAVIAGSINKINDNPVKNLKLLLMLVMGTSLKYQRKVSVAVKRARHLALMPYVADLLK